MATLDVLLYCSSGFGLLKNIKRSTRKDVTFGGSNARYKTYNDLGFNHWPAEESKSDNQPLNKLGYDKVHVKKKENVLVNATQLRHWARHFGLSTTGCWQR